MRHQFQIPYLCLMPCFLPPAAMMHAHAGNGMGRGSINVDNLPLDKDCKPVYPHQFSRAKVIFEVSACASVLVVQHLLQVHHLHTLLSPCSFPLLSNPGSCPLRLPRSTA